MSPMLLCLEDWAFSKSLFSIRLLASFSCDFFASSPSSCELLKVEAATHHYAHEYARKKGL